ncbi:ADP-ribosyltransferase, partial [Streptomyces sp. NPDC050418]|uniref:ADP-ribosyltransferase n=1 Tax=Streptomyces sp. NPDC050418 TaxID=3365612 RepID=UPI0037AE6041
TLSALSKAGKAIDPMTYITKAGGAGLSKLGDIMAGLKGVGTIEIPPLPDTMVRLPEGSLRMPDGSFTLPEGAAIPEGAVTTPTGALKLPEGWTTVSHDSVALPDGRVLEPDGSLISPNGAVDPNPIPAEKLPEQTPVQQPVLVGVHAGDSHVPSGTADNAVPGSTSGGSHLPPHGPGSGPDIPTGPGSHADDGAHVGDDAAGHGDEAAPHGDDAASHGDDAAGHGDDAAHAGNPDHTSAADDAAHAGDESDGAAGDGPGSGASDSTFTYEPSMSEAEFNRLTPDEQHRVAAAELNEGAVSFPDGDAAIAYGRDHWNQYVDDLDPAAKQALWDYTGDTPPSYIDMNGYLRGDAAYDTPAVRADIAEIDKVMAGKPVPEDIMVVRGTGLGHLNLSSYDDMIGKTYPDKGYFSTSLGNNPVASFSGKEAVLHLRVPEGTPALWVEKVSKYDVTERELLLGRGSSYRVTRVFMDDKGQVQVYGEVLPRQ